MTSQDQPAPAPGSAGAADGVTVYRLAPLVAARVLGLGLVLLALLVLASTVLVALTGVTPDLLVVVLVLGVAAIFAGGWWLRSRAFVLRCDPDGYQVGLVRGAGVKQERWTSVEDAVAAHPRGVPAVVLRLRDGRTTTIPVGLLALDRDAFARELQVHLQRGQRLRRL